jgi:hypothetical protein
MLAQFSTDYNKPDRGGSCHHSVYHFWACTMYRLNFRANEKHTKLVIFSPVDKIKRSKDTPNASYERNRSA